MSVHVGYTVTDSTVPHGGSGTPTVRLTQSYTPTKPLQISNRCGGGYYTGDHKCPRDLAAERRAALGPYESVEQFAPISWPEQSSAAGAGADVSPTPPLVGDNDSAGAQPPSAPAESPNSREQYMAESDAVVAAFTAAEEKRLRLAMDIQQAALESIEGRGENVFDWIEVALALQQNWDIQPRQKKTAAG